MGLLSLVLAWCIRRLTPRVGYLRLGSIWLLALSLAIVYLPTGFEPVGWWACFVIILGYAMGAIPWVTGNGARSDSHRSDLAKVLVGTSSVWFLMVFGSWLSHGRAEAIEPFQVLLVGNEADKQLALASPDLIKKLNELVNRGRAPAGAVLVGARYRGGLHGNLAEFAMEFDIYNFSQEASVLIPLSDVNLREGALLDGAPVFPVPEARPKPGYRVAVTGQGRHRLALSASMRPVSAGGHQELRFTGPRLCTNQLEWTMNRAAQSLQLVNGKGEVSIRDVSSDSPRLNSNLGAESIVHLRWQNKKAPIPATLVEVHEAYYWDLRPGLTSLAASLRYFPGKEGLSRLEIGLPESIEIRKLDVISGELALASPVVSVLKKWAVTGAERRPPS